MRPDVRLDPDDLRANAIAWRKRAGVPLRAVVKSDGYGWGFSALAGALDATVDGYYVSDEDEFTALRALTALPIATLGDVPVDSLRSVLERTGIPTVSSVDAIETADAWAREKGTRARVRVALRNATGWSGIPLEDAGAIALLLARTRLDVELSAHVTDETLHDLQLQELLGVRKLMRDAGVTIVGADLASTAPLAREIGAGLSHVRVGVGLFGARFGMGVDVVSALRVEAPVVEQFPARGQRTGYGLNQAPDNGYVAVLRCGYGDGFPMMRDMRIGILAVGMQFTTFHSLESIEGDSVCLIGRNTDLDLLAASAGIGPHQLVVALGNATSAARHDLSETSREEIEMID
jgi:alanine racemase